MAQLRLVLDTNVVVSALVFRAGSLHWLTELWRSETVLPLVSIETKSELTRIISDWKFRLSKEEQDNLLDDYLHWCHTIEVDAPPEVPDCRDPFDRPFLELALFAHADALVTGDADLLALAPVFPIPVITPGELRGCIEETQAGS